MGPVGYMNVVKDQHIVGLLPARFMGADGMYTMSIFEGEEDSQCINSNSCLVHQLELARYLEKLKPKLARYMGPGEYNFEWARSMVPERVAKAIVEPLYTPFCARLYQELPMLTIEGEKIQGAQIIVTKLNSLPFQQCKHNIFDWRKHNIFTVDSQPSGPAGGMPVLVSGNLQFPREEHQPKFVQSMDPDGLAEAFVEHYYTTFDSARVNLLGLYQEQSMLTFEGEKIQGAQNIVTKLNSLPFQQCKHNISTVDLQPSGPAGGMLVFVSGYLKLPGEEHQRKFSQMFHLIPSAHGRFYVFNDIFRLNCA